MIKRLFLGGPLHGRRIMVEDETHHYRYPAQPPVYALAVDDVDPPELLYILRSTPDRKRVFVAPDYGYDTPEWLAFDTEAWVTTRWPEVISWEHRGLWRWRGRLPESDFRHESWLYAFSDGRGEMYCSQLIEIEMVEDLGDDAVDRVVFGDMQHHIDFERLPTCFVEGCNEKSQGGEVDGLWLPAVRDPRGFDKPRELAGPQRLCPAHFSDVLRLPPVFGLLDGITESQIPQWLRPYLRESALSAFDQATDILISPEREYSARFMLRHRLTGAWVTPSQYWGNV